MSKLNIGIAGLGNVGSALVETVEENKNYSNKKYNRVTKRSNCNGKRFRFKKIK